MEGTATVVPLHTKLVDVAHYLSGSTRMILDFTEGQRVDASQDGYWLAARDEAQKVRALGYDDAAGEIEELADLYEQLEQA